MTTNAESSAHWGHINCDPQTGTFGHGLASQQQISAHTPHLPNEQRTARHTDTHTNIKTYTQTHVHIYTHTKAHTYTCINTPQQTQTDTQPHTCADKKCMNKKLHWDTNSQVEKYI